MKHGTTKYNNLMAKEIFLSSNNDFSYGGGGGINRVIQK